MNLPRAASLAALLLLLTAFLALAWFAHDAPLEPGWSHGLLRADGLGALMGVCTALLGLTAARPGRAAAAAALLCAGYLSAHLAALGAALVGAALLLGQRRAGLAAALAAALGLALIALWAGVWRYPVPLAGVGLNSLSFALLLFGALLAAGAAALPATKPGQAPSPPDPLIATGCLYALLRLFSLGPWNLGWLYAAMLLGAAAALWSAGRAALGPPEETDAWLGRCYLALGIVGAGLASGAGVALAGFALLALAALRLAIGRGATGDGGEARESPGFFPPGELPSGGWPLWLLSGALPFTATFTAVWAGVAGAMAGGLSLLAAALWAAALLAVLPVARLAGAPGGSVVAGRGRLLAAAGLSLGIGVAAPAVAFLLIEPAVAQLQSGLTPFGELALWPWAGLIALSAARQPVATLPSLALAALMLVLGALGWAVARLLSLRGSPPPGQD